MSWQETEMSDKQKNAIMRYYEKNKDTINKNRREKYAAEPTQKRKQMLAYLHDMKKNDPVKYRAMLDKKKADARMKAAKVGRVIHPRRSRFTVPDD